MAYPPLRSIRLNGPPGPVHDQLPARTSHALVALVASRIEANWLAAGFPVYCVDGHISGTNYFGLEGILFGEVEGVDWPVARNAGVITDDALFDLVEFVGRHIAEPTIGAFHKYGNHHEMKFDRRRGALRFRDDVNEILSTAGAAYVAKLDEASNLIVEHVATPEVSHALSELNPNTGDSILDKLIEDGRRLYRSREASQRGQALQSLWGAFERLKTVEVPVPKKKNVSAEKLLDHVEPVALRDVVRSDMQAVTDMGNQYRVRHHETYILEVPDEAYDYFVGRMVNLLLVLLRHSGRLAEPRD